MRHKFIVVECDGPIRTAIAKNNKPEKYAEPKLFDTWNDAAAWIAKHTYKGMSFHYEISTVSVK